jgi:hypothetical protein
MIGMIVGGMSHIPITLRETFKAYPAYQFPITARAYQFTRMDSIQILTTLADTITSEPCHYLCPYRVDAVVIYGALTEYEHYEQFFSCARRPFLYYTGPLIDGVHLSMVPC